MVGCHYLVPPGSEGDPRGVLPGPATLLVACETIHKSCGATLLLLCNKTCIVDHHNRASLLQKMACIGRYRLRLT